MSLWQARAPTAFSSNRCQSEDESLRPLPEQSPTTDEPCTIAQKIIHGLSPITQITTQPPRSQPYCQVAVTVFGRLSPRRAGWYPSPGTPTTSACPVRNLRNPFNLWIILPLLFSNPTPRPFSRPASAYPARSASPRLCDSALMSFSPSGSPARERKAGEINAETPRRRVAMTPSTPNVPPAAVPLLCLLLKSAKSAQSADNSASPLFEGIWSPVPTRPQS